MLEEYLQSLLDAVASSRVVRASSITLDRRTLYAGVVRGDLYFADGSHLHYHRTLENHRHHKHAGAETTVVPAAPPQLRAVLQEIEQTYSLD